MNPMTKYLDVADLKKLMASVGVKVMMAEMSLYIQEDFLRWEQYQKSPRTANHSIDGVIELMPVSDDTLFAFKYVNGHPKNPDQHLSTVMAFGVLSEVSTGYPLLLSEMTITTALRTAATSALAAKALARPGCRSMALIGNGAQSEFQAVAFMSQLGIREIRAYDVDAMATEKMLANLQPYVDSGLLHVQRADSIREAVRGADIVTTVTADKTRATILTREMLEPGMHINAVGGDCPGKTELSPGVLETGKVFVEYEPQTRIEGEIQQMPTSFGVQSLWRVLAGKESGRIAQNDVTIFDSVGFALEDLSALRYLMQLAKQQSAGRQIELVPWMRDPKDLYGCATGSAAHAALAQAA